MQPLSYGFQDRLDMSQGISESKNIGDILVGNVAGAVSVRKSTETEDRNGTDWWVKLENGHEVSVDCKVRQQDWAYKPKPNTADDLALETWSVIEKRVIGWTRDKSKRTDYVLWFWIESGRWCLVPFSLLCQSFDSRWRDWRKTYKTAVQKTTRSYGSYHSECVFVPRREVWAAIYRDFGGQPNAS